VFLKLSKKMVQSIFDLPSPIRKSTLALAVFQLKTRLIIVIKKLLKFFAANDLSTLYF